MGVQRWLFKTEPSTYAFSDLTRVRRDVWDGVKNNLALIHLRKIRKGDAVLIYHSGADKAVVGTAKVARGAYPDPEAGDPKLVVVDLQAGAPLAKPVTLAAIRSTAALKNLPLVKISRLSVMPVTAPEWNAIMKLAR